MNESEGVVHFRVIRFLYEAGKYIFLWSYRYNHIVVHFRDVLTVHDIKIISNNSFNSINYTSIYKEFSLH